jgi:hypothetical protein
MKIGDSVRLTGIPSNLHEDTAAVFERCLGHKFVVDHFNKVGSAALVIDSVTGSLNETIWVEQRYLESVGTSDA